MWCSFKVKITRIVAGINFKLLFHFLISYPAALLSDPILFNFIFCLPPSIHSHAHLRRLKFSQLWTITAFRNCKAVTREKLPKTQTLKKKWSVCILSSLSYEIKPLLAALTRCSNNLRGGRWCSVVPSKGAALFWQRPLLLKPSNVRDLRLHDTLYAHNWCGWRIGIEFIAPAEQKMGCILCMSIKEWPVLVLQRMEIGSQTPFVFQNRVSNIL